MPRYCFLLQVRPDRIDEYVERHRAVWPDMLRALRDAGWRNYSLFLRPDGLLVGSVESPDLDAAQAAMAATDVNRRWQAEMAEFFVGLDGRGPDEGFLLLREVFNLEDQLRDNGLSNDGLNNDGLNNDGLNNDGLHDGTLNETEPRTHE